MNISFEIVLRNLKAFEQQYALGNLEKPIFLKFRRARINKLRCRYCRSQRFFRDFLLYSKLKLLNVEAIDRFSGSILV